MPHAGIELPGERLVESARLDDLLNVGQIAQPVRRTGAGGELQLDEARQGEQPGRPRRPLRQPRDRGTTPPSAGHHRGTRQPPAPRSGHPIRRRGSCEWHRGASPGSPAPRAARETAPAPRPSTGHRRPRSCERSRAHRGPCHRAARRRCPRSTAAARDGRGSHAGALLRRSSLLPLGPSHRATHGDPSRMAAPGAPSGTMRAGQAPVNRPFADSGPGRTTVG